MQKKRLLVFCLLVFMSLPLLIHAGMESENFRIPNSVLSGGGQSMTFLGHMMRSTLGQPSPLMGPGDPPYSTSYALYPGFWYTVELIQEWEYCLESVGVETQRWYLNVVDDSIWPYLVLAGSVDLGTETRRAVAVYNGWNCAISLSASSGSSPDGVPFTINFRFSGPSGQGVWISADGLPEHGTTTVTLCGSKMEAGDPGGVQGVEANRGDEAAAGLFGLKGLEADGIVPEEVGEDYCLQSDAGGLQTWNLDVIDDTVWPFLFLAGEVEVDTEIRAAVATYNGWNNAIVMTMDEGVAASTGARTINFRFSGAVGQGIWVDPDDTATHGLATVTLCGSVSSSEGGAAQ